MRQVLKEKRNKIAKSKNTSQKKPKQLLIYIDKTEVIGFKAQNEIYGEMEDAETYIHEKIRPKKLRKIINKKNVMDEEEST